MDTKLYLDPYVIQALSNSFCIEASKCIDSFFQEVFSACRVHNTKKLRKLLEYASEPNETNLGMKKISEYGKGTSAEQLTHLFIEFYKIVRKNPYISINPLPLCMYIKNFDKDKMSDLITNIIRVHLYHFTIEQSNIWNIPLKSEKVFIGYYWDYDTLTWNKLLGHPLSTGHKNILLVPKIIVRPHYVFNVERYIQQYILKTIQQEHINKNSEMCSTKTYANGKKILVPPTIKELYKFEVHGNNHKDYAFYSSAKNKPVEDNFIKNIRQRIKLGYGSITDEKLDHIVYKKQAKSLKFETLQKSKKIIPALGSSLCKTQLT